MLEIRPLIRYGLPGYIALLSTLICARAANVSVSLPAGFVDSDAAVSVALLVAGPFVGFVVHQVYFLYFDTFESYDNSRRPCIKLLARWVKSDERNLNSKEAERVAFVAWKLVMTGSASTQAVGPAMIQALTDLHYYIHSFGAILFACLIGIAAGAATLLAGAPSGAAALAYGIPLSALGLVFWIKRRDLVHRADILERAVLATNRELFVSTMLSLLSAERAWPTGVLTVRPGTRLQLPAETHEPAATSPRTSAPGEKAAGFSGAPNSRPSWPEGP